MRKTIGALVAIPAVAASLALAAPSASAAPPSIKKDLGAIMHASDGSKVFLPQATTLDLYCYFDRPFTGRWFYLKVLSGKHKGLRGDVPAEDVRNQTREPKC